MLKKLLVDVVNGHKIVKAILDNCVGETCEQEDSIDFAIKIDWSGMLTRNENNQIFVPKISNGPNLDRLEKSYRRKLQQ